MPQTIIEKIVQKYAHDLEPGYEVHAGDYIFIRPDYVMTHDNTGAVIPKFRGIGAKKIADPQQVVVTLDHDIQNKSEKNLAKYAAIKAFANEMGVDFYPAGRGIGHQVMVEEGYAWPGTFVVASDSHSNMYGGLGCLGTPMVRTDAMALWAIGLTWWQIPPIAKVELTGKLRAGVTGKDVIITLCGFFNHDEVLNHAVEFCGKGVSQLSIDERLTIANMTTEWGALAGVFPADEITIKWLQNRAEILAKTGSNGSKRRVNQQRVEFLQNEMTHLKSDPGARYARELTLNLDSIQPHVSGPNSVKGMTSIGELRSQKIKIDKAYLLSCVNSRVADIAAAAEVLRGSQVAPGVKFYIAAASSEVQQEAAKRGDWQALLDAGAMELPPGCGPCIGLGQGVLEDGEVGISATNRNFKGRMGSTNAQTYLASPAVVAASAKAGHIYFPGDWDAKRVSGRIKINTDGKGATAKIITGFPKTITGALIFCCQDDLNTDAIYPGKYTYRDELTPEQQAAVVMENYDPDFGKIVRPGDVLVGGFNFGAGSSREQAATALNHAGIQLVLAGSFSETYKRNAFNNGFLALEAPELVHDLKQKHGTEKLTIRTEIKATVDFENSVIDTQEKKYAIFSPGATVQKIIIAGGLENWITEKLDR